jgi:predicted DNA-binding transcriptional regulator AlpA
MTDSTTLPPDPRVSTHQSRDETDERLLTTPEAAADLRVSKSYLDKRRVYGGGPKFLRFGKRKVLYRKRDLDAWAAQHSFNSTSEYQGDRSSIRAKSECMSNNKQRRTTRKLE